MRYRSALGAVGLISGFQWLDGSFLENVEVIESRAPNDIDVVTFYHLPEGKSQRELLEHAPWLISPKASFFVDGFLVNLASRPERLTQLSAYWYSVWSHRRNHAWKGFVQIDLATVEDALAANVLANLGKHEVLS